MTNSQVAQIFNEVAVLLEIKGEDSFRANSYRRVARTINDLPMDINEVATRGELTQLDGVGASSAEKVQELLSTGRLSLREELLSQVPESVLRLLAIPTIGPKRAAALWRDCGICSPDELKLAIQSGQLKSVKGFGPKTVEQIVRGMEFLERNAGRTRLGMAWKISTLLGGAVLAMKGVERAEFAGSLRRGCETVGDLDLLCSADDAEKVVRQFAKLPHVTEVLKATATKILVLVDYEPIGSLRVDLRVVPPRSFGAAWHTLTGSREHAAQVRARAQQRGWTMNELGLYAGDRLVASLTEEDVYAALDLPWIPPELRENLGELELTEVPRDLLQLGHLRGDLHMHTVASDGRNTIEEMIAAARDRGYEYLCITEHSQSSAIAGGLKEELMHGYIKDVRAIARRTDDIRLWIGSEVDILSDGRLDYSDEILSQLDFVVASVHYGMTLDKEANTRRVLAAMQSPYVNCIGHPTGRLINEREAMPLDMEAICREAARTGTALEINANNFRLDLKDEHARLACNAGAMLVVNTDSHAIDQLEQIRFGVMTARRAWVRRGDVLNAHPAKDVLAFVAKKRKAHAAVRA